MTEIEIMNIFEELYGAGLGNAPKDPAAAVKVWMDFFGGDDARVIGKAVGIHLKKCQFWPTPADIEKLKERAEWISEVEQQRFREMEQLKLESPKAPEIKIDVFCTGSAVCPYFDMDVCGGSKEEHEHCSL